MAFSPCVLFCLALSFLHAQGSLEGGLSVNYLPLEEDALYEFLWAGSVGAARAEEVAALRSSEEQAEDDQVQLLPNVLLPYGYTDEVVTIATADQEHYKCVLPRLHTSQEDEDGQLDSKYLTPESLLQPLQYQCLKLVQGYWTYELCHGQSLRQYHEENTGKGIKVDEFMLGEVKKPWKPNLGDTGQEGLDEEEGEGGDKTEEDGGSEEKVPTWHFNGFDYPYYNVEMIDGSTCDIRGNNPRSVSVLYICQTDAPTFGMLLLVEEASTCHYVAIIGTKQLCQNKSYKLKEQPVHTITCYAEDDSPKKPGALRVHELEMLNFQPKSPPKATKPTSKGSSKAADELPPGPSLDEGIVMSFLSGDMCLRGGSGWWIHELCLQKQVKQIHQESDMSETQVTLGVWDEEKHNSWYLKDGHKRVTQTTVTHIYPDGDLCEITGKPRLCYVKFKCTKTKPPTQISLYLLEQSTCVYTLTVEGSFICPLLGNLDRHGMFQLGDGARLFDKPRTDSSSDSKSGQPQEKSGSASGQSQTQSSSASGQPQAKSGSASGPKAAKG